MPGRVQWREERCPASSGPARPGRFTPGCAPPGLVTAAARAVPAPVLCRVRRGDELFPLRGQVALFGALGSAVKRLVTRPGPHGKALPRDEAPWAEFLAGRAAGDGAAAGR